MIVLIVDENTLEVGLEQAYKSFNESASVYLEERGVSSSYVHSSMIIITHFKKCNFIQNTFLISGVQLQK